MKQFMLQMNDFVRDKFTPNKGEGTIPLYGEIIAGGTVSQHNTQKANSACMLVLIWIIIFNSRTDIQHHVS